MLPFFPVVLVVGMCFWLPATLSDYASNSQLLYAISLFSIGFCIFLGFLRSNNSNVLVLVERLVAHETRVGGVYFMWNFGVGVFTVFFSNKDVGNIYILLPLVSYWNDTKRWDSNLILISIFFLFS